MRFATRTFLGTFVPFAVLLLGSFWAIQTLVISKVREGLRASLRQTQTSIAAARTRSEFRNSQVLRVVGESAALKAGLQLMLAHPGSRAALLTVEDQLREICESLGFDFLLVSSPEGAGLAGVMRRDGRIVPMKLIDLPRPHRGIRTVGADTYQFTPVPVDQGEENIATLVVGERFDLSSLSTGVVLMRHGKLAASGIPGISAAEVESGLAGCPRDGECEVRLSDETYLSLPLEDSLGDGYLLRSLQSLDAATGPMLAILRRVFLVTAIGALLAALIISVLASRTIVQPISAVVAHLRESAKTAQLPEFSTNSSSIQEIRELGESFNQAAAAIRSGEEALHRAYVEFVGSMAGALDARDGYTAGHSIRVSDLSCAIAEQLGITGEEVDIIRAGAILHDIGKIGISDSLLLKPGPVTAEEYALIQRHPMIGRRILEGVRAFQPYLRVVELHHENWDGSGYPRGLRGEEIPICARIVHVADAYDAMTSDRPYRPGMNHQEATLVLQKAQGTQFDPAVVSAFSKLEPIPGRRPRHPQPHEGDPSSIRRLAEALSSSASRSQAAPVESRQT